MAIEGAFINDNMQPGEGGGGASAGRIAQSKSSVKLTFLCDGDEAAGRVSNLHAIIKE